MLTEALVVNPNGTVRIPSQQRDRLYQRAKVEVLDRLETARVDGVQPLGIYPLFSLPRMVIGQDRDWLIMSMDSDPDYQRSQFPIPSDVRRHLTMIANASVDFDRLYVAHELPKGILDPSATTVFLPSTFITPPHDLVQRSAKQGSAATNALLADLLPTAAVFALGTVGAAVVVAAGAVAAAGVGIGLALATALPLALDPVLFGAITENGSIEDGEPAMFLVLAQWKA